MESNLASSPPAINICSRIKCPFYNSDSDCNRCTRYFNSRYCHLTLVFAFKADGYSLFADNESEIRHIKQVNQNWIAQNTNNSREVISSNRLNSNSIQTTYNRERKRFPAKSLPGYLPYFLGRIVSQQSMISANLLANSVTMLNSIQFEEY